MSDMENKTQGKKRGHVRLSFQVIIGLVLLLSVVASIIVYLLGYFAIAIKQPGERVVTAFHVCDSSDAQKFRSDVQSGRFLEASKVDSLVRDIKTRRNVDMDPTCVGILAYGALASKDAGALELRVKQLKEMKEKGLYMNDDVAMYMSTSYADSMLSLLKSNNLPFNGLQ